MQPARVMMERYMTPHDLDCVFCRIIRGELDSATIYVDESTLAYIRRNLQNVHVK